jgi:hypothetical protein
MTDPGYRAYGLTFASPTPLLGFAPSSSAADVVIRERRAPDRLDGAKPLGLFWSATRDEVLIETPAVVRHHITRGGVLTIDRQSAYSAPDEQIYGVPIAASLAFSGLTVMHGAGAIPAGRDGALLFVGSNGIGKSSLAMALASKGGVAMCDNLAALEFCPTEVLLRPGPSAARLWADTAIGLDIDLNTAPRANPDMPKHVFSRPTSAYPARLAGIVVLAEAPIDRPTLSPIEGRSAIIALLDNHFRRTLMAVLSPSIMERAAAIAARVPVFRLTRPLAGWDPGSLADFVQSTL